MNQHSKLFTAFAVIVFACLMVASPALAQGTDDPPPSPCTPDCANLPWSQVKTTTFQISACGHVCSVTVYFHTRTGFCTNLGIWLNEFQVTQVELDPTCVQNCAPDEYLKQVTLFMLLFNKANFPLPTPGTCTNDYRASMSACQFTWYNGRTGKSYVIKCANSTECCVANYRVCTDGTGQVASVKTVPPGPIPPNACPGDPTGNPNILYPCKPSCNALTDLIDPYYSKRAIFTNDPAQGGATVVPNPAQGKTIITSPTMEDGGASLLVYTASGDLILNQSQEGAIGGRYAFAIDASYIPSGAYFYLIKPTNGAFIAGSLQVAK